MEKSKAPQCSQCLSPEFCGTTKQHHRSEGCQPLRSSTESPSWKQVTYGTDLLVQALDTYDLPAEWLHFPHRTSQLNSRFRKLLLHISQKMMLQEVLEGLDIFWF